MKIDLRKFRKDRGLSQKQIGSMFGTGQTNISMLESGNRDLTDEQYDILVKNFGESEVLKYASRDKQEPKQSEFDLPLSLEAWEIIKQQTQIIKSLQEVIKSQQNTIDFLSKKDSTIKCVPDANAI